VITDDMSMPEVALAIAAAGMYVFPVDHPELPQCAGIGQGHNPKTCNERGKHPAVAFTTAADTNPRMIHMWWAGGPRNIGINVGKSGLVVIDEDELGAFKKYADEHGHKITPTMVVATAKGRHYYYVALADTQLGNEAGALKDYSIDVRAGNAYVVGPGSIHKTGVVYRFEVARPPAPLPDWVVQAIKAKTNGHKDDGGVWETVGDDFDRFELPEVIKDHTRDDTLFKYASSLLARELPRGEAEILMRAAWQRCEQPPKAESAYTVEEALAKLDRYEPGRSEGYEKGGRRDGDGPSVDVRNDAQAADWLRKELGQGRLAGIFRRGDMLVHTPQIGEEGYRPPKDLGLIDAGPAQVRPLTTVQVKSLIEAEYECWKNITVQEGDKRSRVKVPAMFPQQAAQSACESARLGEYAPNLKTLHGVTHTPMLRPDGTILHTPGYDAATGFLYLPDRNLEVQWIPDRPSPDEIKAAVELILTPVAEFPFVSDDDRATWIGLLLTPILRPLLPGPYPLGVFTATNPGSGKTLLAKLIRIIHGGVQRGEMPRDADELRKSITATLLDTTGPVVTFDNLTGVIRSSVLESLLTDREWTDRWLGQNRSVTAINDRLWLATGNNAAFGGDLARRIETVRLDPPGANPHLRTGFKIGDLEAWMREHRGELLAAILTVARGWVVAGMPSESVRSDSYRRWIGGLRGMLGWAGFPGVFGGSSSEVAVSSDDEEWHAFLVEVHGAFGTEPFTVKELVGELRAPFVGGRIDAAALPGDLAEKWSHIREGRDDGFRKSLGWWFRNREGRYASGWAVVAAEPDGHAKVARYAVKPPGNADDADQAQDEDPGENPGRAPDGEESAGLRGYSGFLTATRERETVNLDSGAGGDRPGENPQNPVTPQSEDATATAACTQFQAGRPCGRLDTMRCPNGWLCEEHKPPWWVQPL
jgi:hypothetical protein